MGTGEMQMTKDTTISNATSTHFYQTNSNEVGRYSKHRRHKSTNKPSLTHRKTILEPLAEIPSFLDPLNEL